MSDCGICLTGFDDGGCSEFIHTKIRKARKPHRCSECQKEIPISERYEHAVGKTDGDIWAYDTCLVCAEIAEAFYCDGRWWGGMLWEQMEEVIPEMTTGCLNRLTTAAAKAELIRRWNEWMFQK